ncbi:GDSL esterase/lipase At3g48460-like [Diospyros lotus]|uniref:GDSL esterase/lipase At3g48460-like n=1 Tax=Diospyros lotus TaxID=55363 RepID=UPI002256A3B9|nr:GDSL esterase/lipase At3g48460-like [Diospyros lotus]
MVPFAYFTIIVTSIFILISSLPPPSAAAPTGHQRQPPFKKIYAFGDSFTDTGNTGSATGPSGFSHVSSLPYGCTFFHRPTNRYSDGRLVIDFVAQYLSLPFLPPYRRHKAGPDSTSPGVNFAVAGSTAIKHSFFVRNNLTLNITPQSLGTQLVWFDKYMEAQGYCRAPRSRQCRAAMDEALFWVGEIGANDYAYTVGSSVSRDTIQRLAIKSVTGFLQALLTKGAKYVVVQGLPTTGCLPLSLTLTPADDRDALGCAATVNRQSFRHNLLLQSTIHQLRTQFPHSVILYADYWNAYRTIMKNAAAYGFQEPIKACCGSGGGPYNFDIFGACGSPLSSSCPDPSKYINWDGVHLTEAMYKAVSELFINGTFSHPPFKYLLSRKASAGGLS